MTVRLFNNQLLLAKLEVSFGTDSVPVAASNSVLCFPVNPEPDREVIDYPVVRASISAAKERIGLKMVNFTISVPLKGSGNNAHDVPPECSPLLQSCRFKETINAGVSVVYTPTPSSEEPKSCTIYHYLDGVATKAVGCRGNAKISAEAGKPPTIELTLRGRLLSHGDEATPAGSVLQSTDPVVVESGGMSFGAFNDAVVTVFGFNTGNETFDEKNINAVGGCNGVAMGGRDPRWNASLRATLEASHAWIANIDNRVEEAIDLTIGTVAGNTVAIAVPKACCSPRGYRANNQNGQVYYELEGQALENSSNDNITITFT